MSIKRWEQASTNELIEQLEMCGYECEAGILTMNVAFIELKQKLVEQENALRFYADFNNYSSNTAHNGYDVVSDKGEIARKSLK